MNGSEIRKAFLDFFKSKGHAVVGSSSLIPQNDPTILFTNAGMNQFKDVFLGAEARPYTRAATCQKCMRISGKHNDLENVGVTPRHHTFFEMLGNFSFGDYFKEEAIKSAWELVTGVFGIPKERLWITIFEKDDEAGQLWHDLVGVPSARILRLGEADNFWSMGETGPCGPCSEMHVYLGEDLTKQSEAGFRAEDGNYLEIWNLVFMQFDRGTDGRLTPLPKPSIDTGMGLERMTAVKNNLRSNYDTDLLRGVIAECERLSGFKYEGHSYHARDLKRDSAYARDVAMRVIADHSRSVAFLIGDGAHPGSDGRGYVLRRIIRRAIRHGRVLNFTEPFLAQTTAQVIAKFEDIYPELRDRRDIIRRIVDAEERKFHETLDAGLAVLQREVEQLGSGQMFPGETAFLLHDTYGFPLDLTQDALKAYSLNVDVEGFNRAMENQKTRSREDRKSHGIAFHALKVEGGRTAFLGYEHEEAEAKLLECVGFEGTAQEGDRVTLVFDSTPFYAESGGQVGDTGVIRFTDVELKVLDTQKTPGGCYLHDCEVMRGKFCSSHVQQQAMLCVDAERRRNIRAHHSSTHLVHAALRKVLGTHVKQAGSRVDENSLRFDYSHFEPLSAQQWQDIETFINEEVRNNYGVQTQEMPLGEARARGAMALFGEKYGEVVRVVEIGPHSLELCGGTHVRRAGDIGFIVVVSDSGISAGVRRIECYCGAAALREVMRERNERLEVARLLKGDAANLPSKVEKVLNNVRLLEHELDTVRARLASAASGTLIENAKTTPRGIRVIAERIEGADSETLKSMVDKLRVTLGSGVVALGSAQGEVAIIVAGVTPDLAASVHAGNLIREAVKIGGGKGGGRQDFAQAGGLNPALLHKTLEKVVELVP